MFGLYKFRGGYCQVLNYIIDDDNNIDTPFNPIPGFEDGVTPGSKPCDYSSAEKGEECRTFYFNTLEITTYTFYVHVLGTHLLPNPTLDDY